MGCSAKIILKLSPIDISNQGPMEGMALNNQIFIPIDHLVNMETMLVAYKCPGKCGERK